MEKEVRLVDYLYLLYQRRRLITLFMVVTVGATVLFTFPSPKLYEARAVLMPEMGGAEDVGLRSAFAQHAQQLGVSVPGQKTGHSAVLTSGPFTERVAERLNYAELARMGGGSGPASPEISKREAAGALLGAAKVEEKGGLITIRVTSWDPFLASHIANTYAAELDRYNRESNLTKAKRLRLFLEDRLRQANRELTLAQKDLRAFQEQHKAISIADQAKQTLSTLTILEARKLDLEIQREAQERFVRDSHTQAKTIQAQLAALQKNIEQLKYANVMARYAERDGPLEYYVPLDQVPLLSFQESRLLLEAGTKSKVVELLTIQLEQAKLDEARELPTITILESAVAPGSSIRSKIKLNLLLGALVGLFVGVTAAFVAAHFEREAQDIDSGMKWQEMRQGLWRDLRRVVRLGRA